MEKNNNAHEIIDDMMNLMLGLSLKTGKPLSHFTKAYDTAKNATLQQRPEPFDSRELKEHEDTQNHNFENS